MVFLLATASCTRAWPCTRIGYLRTAGTAGRADQRYARRFWAGLNLFAWSMLTAPLMSNLALLWVAIEVTTIVSALLVALEGTDGAAEAAWKYVLLASAGLAHRTARDDLHVLRRAHRYSAQSYDLAFTPLLAVAARLPHTAVRLAFVLAVLGFGTKVGLFPVHTWLPDAHSEAPTPVSALLSGSLLAVSFYAILRFYQIAPATLGPRFPRDVLLVFGVASLLLAALYLLDQRDYKRLLAYSSVEHMGILAIGVSFGAPVALAGVLLHVLAHAAAKGNAFMGAGVLVRKFGTKQISVRHWRPGPAALERAAVPRRHPGAVGDAAVRDLPQRVRDRHRRAGRVANVAGGHPGRPGHDRVPRAVRWPPTGCFSTPRRGRRPAGLPPGVSRACGWWCRSWPAWSRCWCSGLHPPGELTGLLDRAVADAAGRRHDRRRPRPGRCRRAGWSAASPADCGTADHPRRHRGPPVRRADGHPAARRRAFVRAPGRDRGDRHRHEVGLPPGAELVPGADPGARRGVLVRAGDPRPVRDRPGRAIRRLEPLILPQHDQHGPRPRPGAPAAARPAIWPDEHSVPRHVLGPGLFTIPHGPVRSGVMESIEYLVETPGEDIPHLNMRVFYKHRGIEKRFEGMTRRRRRAAR